MKRLKYIMLYIGLLAMNACSPEKIAPADEAEQNTEVRLVANISGSENGSRADSDTPEYIKTAFTAGDEIRLANTVLFSTPDFTKQKTIFTCTGEYDSQKGYKFTPDKSSDTESDSDGSSDTTDDTDGTTSITWDDFTPTVFAYTFEAAYYPGGDPFDEIPTDQNQNNGQGFKNADLLIATSRMATADKYKDIELTFHHAFAMVRVEAIVPTGIGGLPVDAIQEAWMMNVQTAYHIDYTSTIIDGSYRTVTGSGDRTNIKMWLESKVSQNNTQTYIFLGIIPVPNPDNADEQMIEQNDFIHFKVKVDDHTTKTYRFVPETSFKLEQAHITVLRLQLNENNVLPLLLSAEITPWTQASAEMILDEEDPTNDTPSEGDSSDNQQGEDQQDNQQGGTEP